MGTRIKHFFAKAVERERENIVFSLAFLSYLERERVDFSSDLRHWRRMRLREDEPQ